MQEQSFYQNCKLCPNLCGVDRLSGQLGICGQSSIIKVAWSGLHKGEEPPVSGDKGSGMIFFSGCSLHCKYCQNYQISSYNTELGIDINITDLATMMLELDSYGANTINLVTGTHFAPSIIEAIKKAKENGLNIPIVWNSSGFETVELLELINPYIDCYLFDLKTLNRLVASRFCGRKEYANVIIPALNYLAEKRKKEDLLIRHLVFPGTLNHSKKVIEWFGKNLKDKALFSLMVQFVSPYPDQKFDPISTKEYDYLIDLLEENEIEDGFVQELGDEQCWIPDFTKDNPFPEDFANTLPYYQELKNRAK